MYISNKEIKELNRIDRINLINSLSGYKPANLIGSRSKAGQENLAIFSSVVHLGSNPPLLGCFCRPNTVERHTYDNIIETGVYTINHVHVSFIEKAHYTSAKFDKGESEFERCALTPEYRADFWAPAVSESQLIVEMEFKSEYPISENGVILLVGEIKGVQIKKAIQRGDGMLDLSAINDVCISGLDTYHKVSAGKRFPYARKEELPDFGQKSRPDQVVYDEETDSYNASMLPYATSVSGPSFKATDLTQWKNASAGKVSAHFKTRFEEIKSEYEAMVEQFSWNEIVYTAKFSFEPIVGQVYHLYERDNGERILSMIPPESWKMNHLGSFMFNSDKMWMKA